MSKNIIFKLDSKGVRDLLKSSEAKEVCKPYADRVLAFAGEGYSEEEYSGKYRDGYAVKVETPHAYYSNLKHNTLEKAIGGAKK